MPSFKLDTFDPSGKLKNFLNAIEYHFESLEKETYIRVFNQFNAI